MAMLSGVRVTLWGALQHTVVTADTKLHLLPPDIVKQMASGLGERLAVFVSAVHFSLY